MRERPKVTRKALRRMRIGETCIFDLPEIKLINSARVTCNQLKHEEGLTFTVRTDYEARAVSVTRLK